MLHSKLKPVMKNIYILSFFILGSIIGCDDYLDVEPETLVTPEVALSTEADIVSALHGSYAYLNDDGYAMEHNVIGSVSCDDGKVPSDREAAGAANDRLPHAYSLELTAQTTTNELWLDSYQIIAGVNNILEALEENEFDAGFENRVTAECRALRALMHFSLTQVFAQDYGFTSDQSHLAVPYLTVSTPGESPSRSTMAEVYTRLFEDVNSAITLFETDGSDEALNNFRNGGGIYFFSRAAAIALRARMNF